MLADERDYSSQLAKLARRGVSRATGDIPENLSRIVSPMDASVRMGGAVEEPPEPRAGGADSARNKRGFQDRLPGR